MSEPGHWEILKSEIVFHNKWVTIQKDAVKLPNGLLIDDYYLNVRPEVAIALPVTKDGKAIMVRQYKHGGKTMCLEFPGGVFDVASETPVVGALREMREETGYYSEEMIYLGKVFDDPTKDTNCIHFFLAKNAYKKYAPEPDVTENIEILEVPFEDIPELIKTNKMQVCGSIAIYTLAAMHLKK
jgi:8-oxo-dGTP pyrophosphatase MutT (NUDIX family)